ncbi:MAG TPA: hypothetical protein VIQ97_05995 [Prevotella sp.]
MKKFFAWGCALCLAIWATACQTSKNSYKSAHEVPYTVVRNYFFTDEKPLPITPKITDEHIFHSMFGMAAVMGIDGQPTKINFKKEFVVAVVYPPTDRHTELSPLSLHDDGETLTFTYKEQIGQKNTWTMQPMLIIAVNRKYQTHKVVLKKQ